jgi:hypothetical protein
MQGMLANPYFPETSGNFYLEGVTEGAVRHADALIAALEGGAA